MRWMELQRQKCPLPSSEPVLLEWNSLLQEVRPFAILAHGGESDDDFFINDDVNIGSDASLEELFLKNDTSQPQAPVVLNHITAMQKVCRTGVVRRPRFAACGGRCQPTTSP